MLSINATLKTFWLEVDSTIIDKERHHICHITSANTTMRLINLIKINVVTTYNFKLILLKQ